MEKTLDKVIDSKKRDALNKLKNNKVKNETALLAATKSD